MSQVRALRVTGSDLRLRRSSLAVWTASVLLLVLLIIGVYPSIRDNPSLDSIYGDLSSSAQALLGGSELTSPAGYLSTQLFAFFLPAVLLVFAIGRGAAAVAGEEEDRTLDLLLAQPMTRRSLYLEKTLAVVIGLGLLVLASWLPLVVLRNAVRLDVPTVNLLAVCVQMGLFCVALGLGAGAVSAASGRRALGTAAGAGYTFVSYLVYGLSATVHWLSYLRPLSLWRWYLGNDPLRTGFGGEEVAVLLGVCVLVLVGGVTAFARRDLRG
ncbi:MAG TPA: ABC transporter permease subunit [Sporichthyaceae bacterium]|jgi:ABC-2 type transport system permease protein